MKSVISILFFLSVASSGLAMSGGELGKDSVKANYIYSVEFKQDTLYIKAHHFSICCDKFVRYNDIKEKRKELVLNIIYKNLDNECLCKAERVVTHKIHIVNPNAIKFQMNGEVPDFGVKRFVNSEHISKKELRRREKAAKNKD